MTTNPLLKSIIEEYKTKFGLCKGEHSNCSCGKEIKWLTTSIERVFAECEKHARLIELNSMSFIENLQHRCPQCGKETETPMTYGKSRDANALWGRCFECATRDNNSGTFDSTLSDKE